MNFNRLDYKRPQRLRLIRQTGQADCGLACIQMLLAFHKKNVDHVVLQMRCQVGRDGMSAGDIIAVLTQFGLMARGVKIAPESMKSVDLPAIAYLKSKHFVVISEAKGDIITIFDPASDRYHVSTSEFIALTDGVVIIVDAVIPDRPALALRAGKLSSIFGAISGLYAILAGIFSYALTLEILSLILPLSTQIIIDDVIPSKDTDLLVTVILALIIITCVQQVIFALRLRLHAHLANIFSLTWNYTFINSVLRQKLQDIAKFSVGDVVTRFGIVNDIAKSTANIISTSFVDGVMSFLTIVLMIYYNWKLSILSIMSITIYILFRLVRFIPLRKSNVTLLKATSEQQTHLMETIRGIRAVKAFDAIAARRISWVNLFIRQLNISTKIQYMNYFYNSLSGSLRGAEKILTLWIATSEITSNAFSIGAMVAYMSYRDQAESKAISFVDSLFEYKNNVAKSKRIIDIIPGQLEREAFGGNVVMAPILGIYLENVTFKYDMSRKNIISISKILIDGCRSFAIIGYSGSGKTTFAALLSGLLEPNSGRICFKLPNNKLAHVSSMRKIIATVSQDDTLFDGSILENLCFFSETPELNLAESCLHLACLMTDVSRMPLGLHTPIGENGRFISGGQRQRLLIARALYKKPQILLLDEATTNIDSATERKIFANINQKDIMKIVVTHNLEVASYCDKTYSIMGGGLMLVENLFEKSEPGQETNA